MIKVLITDQHPIFTEGLRLIMKPLKDIECVGVAHDNIEAANLAKKILPDIIITEIIPPYADNLDFVKQIKIDFPATRVVLLSQFDCPDCIKAAISAKVDGFLLKSTAQSELIDALRMVYSGKGVFDRQIISAMFDTLDCHKDKSEDNKDSLSHREMEVLSCIAAGMSNKAVSYKLGIRPNTTACHLRNIYQKLGVDSRTAAVACAIAMDIVSVKSHYQ